MIITNLYQSLRLTFAERLTQFSFKTNRKQKEKNIFQERTKDQRGSIFQDFLFQYTFFASILFRKSSSLDQNFFPVPKESQTSLSLLLKNFLDDGLKLLAGTNRNAGIASKMIVQFFRKITNKHQGLPPNLLDTVKAQKGE